MSMVTAKRVGIPGRARLLAHRPRGARARAYPAFSIGKWLVFLGFSGVTLLSMIATNWSIGLPVRSLAAATLLVMTFISYPNKALVAVRRIKWFLGMAALVTAAGGTASIVAGDSAESILRGITEIGIQAVVLTALAAVVAEICGSGPVFVVFVAVIGASALIAIGQYFGLSFAWSLRTAIGGLQGDTLRGADDALEGSGVRAVGLSFSKTILGAQICLAMSAYYLISIKPAAGRSAFRLQLTLGRAMTGMVLLFAVAFAGGNRSPILGGVIFLLIFASRNRPHLFVAALFSIAAIMLLAEPILSLLRASGSRVFETSDNSSLMRGTLTRYGLLLFLDNPLGYGLSFNPTDHALAFVGQFSGDPNRSAIFRYPLHNYLISMFNIYGLMFFVISYFALNLFRRHIDIFIIFIPYIVHIMFHNSGPFYQNEIFFWLAAGALPRMIAERRSWAARFRPANPPSPALARPQRGQPGDGLMPDREGPASHSLELG